ncbi:hypothetical protein PVAND_012868 [Polypedilum vanderplanki]|uniref:Uncharacterized protein n=1 Tax=Polypedilum vanderplanki TaxID=319348 RepID=A0A9J6CPQ5_POLVA|nr:hypothetical protein PVAND_012868 [Polypedilum vanderplanki]
MIDHNKQGTGITHSTAICRWGNTAAIYDPNFHENYPSRLGEVPGKAKYREVLKRMNFSSKNKDNFILIGGGGNFYGECHAMTFNTIRNFVEHSWHYNFTNTVESFYGYNDSYKQIKW